MIKLSSATSLYLDLPAFAAKLHPFRILKSAVRTLHLRLLSLIQFCFPRNCATYQFRIRERTIETPGELLIRCNKFRTEFQFDRLCKKGRSSKIIFNNRPNVWLSLNDFHSFQVLKHWVFPGCLLKMVSLETGPIKQFTKRFFQQSGFLKIYHATRYSIANER